MIRKMRFQGLAGALPVWANSFCPAGAAGCVMISSCRISRYARYDWTWFLSYIETVALRCAGDKKTAFDRGECGNCPLGCTVCFAIRRNSHQPRESQSFSNDV